MCSEAATSVLLLNGPDLVRVLSTGVAQERRRPWFVAALSTVSTGGKTPVLSLPRECADWNVLK